MFEPITMTLAAVSVASTAYSAVQGFQQQRYQAQMMERQAAINRRVAQRSALMMEQQGILMSHQAKVMNQQAEMVGQQAVYNQQLANQQAKLQQNEAERRAMRIRQEARQNALAETRQAEALMDQQRDRRDAIEMTYANAGVTLEGTPAAMLNRQREVDRLNIDLMQWEGYNRRRSMAWEANEVVSAGEAEASATRYQGLVQSYNLKAEAAALRGKAAGVKAEAAMQKGAADMRRYEGEVAATTMMNRAQNARGSSWGQLVRGAGQIAGTAAMVYQPSSSTTTTTPAAVPTGPSYFKAGNPVRPPPAPSPSMFRG